jgi:activator of HSP90 ATPase
MQDQSIFMHMKPSQDGSPEHKLSREIVSPAIVPLLVKNRSSQEQEQSNTYELSSKVISPELNRGNNSSTLNQNNFNLSPDPPDIQMDSIEEDSDKNEQDVEVAKPNKINNPAFDSSPINEDDEYDGIRYAPTP